MLAQLKHFFACEIDNVICHKSEKHTCTCWHCTMQRRYYVLFSYHWVSSGEQQMSKPNI